MFAQGDNESYFEWGSSHGGRVEPESESDPKAGRPAAYCEQHGKGGPRDRDR